ncbi:MAG: hypothetical protein ACQKBV_07120 [Puniceicoccales bacterium]
MIIERIPQISTLTKEEMLVLSDELVYAATHQGEHVMSDEEVADLLEKTWGEYLRDPTQVVTLDELKKRIETQKLGQ